MKKTLFSLAVLTGLLSAQTNSPAWNPDNGDGTYRNPVVYADYSDPDVIRIGSDYFMVSSSFVQTPGLPLLHSKDLVHWTIVNHIVQNIPYGDFKKPLHGNGIWAPALRYHNGWYYVYYGDADYGIFMSRTKNPFGRWEPLTLVQQSKGWIDPCPLWDEDGQAYLVHAFAKSRAGFNSRLTVHKMSPDGKQLLDSGTVVFDGTAKHPTIEGPKLYKRSGWYYIFAPAGGVPQGWQTILRSRNIFGPYEDKIVLEQGSSTVNGPHQGAWITAEDSSSWFIHFQDKDAFGRIVHLQPVHWENDWPLMGIDKDGNGIGEPVLNYKIPYSKSFAAPGVPQTSDEFTSSEIGLQWQWEANHNDSWYSLSKRKGYLRLFSQISDSVNLYNIPNVIGQKIPAPEFKASVKMEYFPSSEGEKAGLIVLGMDYAVLYMRKEGKSFKLVQSQCLNASSDNNEEIQEEKTIGSNTVFMRVNVNDSGICSFQYSADGTNYTDIGKTFKARKGRWVGARICLFSRTADNGHKPGYADFDFLRFTK
ncbi:MAG: glycoside hydrolase 43 family protein [Syntrophothermus sp.]